MTLFYWDTVYLPILHVPELVPALATFHEDTKGGHGLSVGFITPHKSQAGPDGLQERWGAFLLTNPLFLHGYLRDFKAPEPTAEPLILAARVETSLDELMLQLELVIPIGLWPQLGAFCFFGDIEATASVKQAYDELLVRSLTDLNPDPWGGNG